MKMNLRRFDRKQRAARMYPLRPPQEFQGLLSLLLNDASAYAYRHAP